jgi:hypothetical protein
MNRHDLDAVSLVFGLVFFVFVGWWLLMRWVAIEAPGFGWFAAAALLVFGALGVIATLTSGRRRGAADKPN